MFAINTRKMDATRIYLLMSAGTSLFFTMVFGANLIYQVQNVGLNPLELVLVGTVLEGSIFLLEVPTGVVADVYSRRLSIIIGFFLIGAGFIVEGSFPIFGAVLLSQVLWGIGYTFTSGATEAWITDETDAEHVGAIFMRASQISSLVGIGGTVIAIVLGSLLINLPIVLGGLLFIAMAVFLIFTMPETGFQRTPTDERSTRGQMGDTLRGGIRVIRRSPTLLAILGIGLFFGLYSEGFDRLTTAHMLQDFVIPNFGGLQPVAWMGILGIFGNLLSVIATQIVKRRVDMTKSHALARASFLITGLLTASLFGFALAGNFFVMVVMGWGVSVFRSLIGPIQSTWINQHIDSNVRATVISMNSQTDAIGQIIGGPPVGFIGNTFGIRAALVSSGLILSPVLYLYSRIIRRDQIAPPVSEPAPAPAE